LRKNLGFDWLSLAFLGFLRASTLAFLGFSPALTLAFVGFPWLFARVDRRDPANG
jgi:hypothetical protein